MTFFGSIYEPSSGWSLFSLQAKPYSQQCYVIVIDEISWNLYKIKLKIDSTV
jgi:hypothetical protein